MATTKKRFQVYAYSAPLRGAKAAVLAAAGYDVTVAIERSDGRAMTERELRQLQATFPQAAPTRRKATPKRAAARTGTVKHTRRAKPAT
jgi:hypothetical protein